MKVIQDVCKFKYYKFTKTLQKYCSLRILLEMLPVRVSSAERCFPSQVLTYGSAFHCLRRGPWSFTNISDEMCAVVNYIIFLIRKKSSSGRTASPANPHHYTSAYK